MTAPESTIEQVRRAISVVPFARTFDDIGIARIHLKFSCNNLGANSAASRNFGVAAGTSGPTFYGDHHTMAIAIELSSEAW
jgi:hypothetical protein